MFVESILTSNQMKKIYLKWVPINVVGLQSIGIEIEPEKEDVKRKKTDGE